MLLFILVPKVVRSHKNIKHISSLTVHKDNQNKKDRAFLFPCKIFAAYTAYTK